MPTRRSPSLAIARFAWRSRGGPALVCRAARAVRRASLHDAASGRSARRRTATERQPGRRSRAALGVDAARLVRAHQVHGARSSCGAPAIRRAATRRFRTPTSSSPTTRRSSLAVQTADCVPLLIADRRTGAVAAAHAGWRGLAAGVPEVAVAALARAFGSRPADLVAAIGPSIGACCYEVGDEVRERVRDGGLRRAELAAGSAGAASIAGNPSMPDCRQRRADHWFFDGWTAARDQLDAAGVPAGSDLRRRSCAPPATRTRSVLVSARRHEPAGRIAGVIRRFGRVVHSGVREPIGVRVRLAADVLEGDACRARARAAAPWRAAAAGPRSSPCSCRASAAPAAANRSAREARGAPWRRAHSSAASRPRYSATLLVATPIDSPNSSTSVPSGCSMRTP